jgi:hypothetical protein
MNHVYHEGGTPSRKNAFKHVAYTRRADATGA